MKIFAWARHLIEFTITGERQRDRLSKWVCGCVWADSNKNVRKERESVFVCVCVWERECVTNSAWCNTMCWIRAFQGLMRWECACLNMCMCACVRARKPKIKQKSNIEKNLIRVTILNFFKSGQVMKNLSKKWRNLILDFETGYSISPSLLTSAMPWSHQG